LLLREGDVVKEITWLTTEDGEFARIKRSLT
jgi:hypothetical protein